MFFCDFNTTRTPGNNAMFGLPRIPEGPLSAPEIVMGTVTT
jgi:hypothetical protein